MRTILLAALEKKIRDWMDEECEGEYWPDLYVHDNLATQMAAAAEAVFDASFDGQCEKAAQEEE